MIGWLRGELIDIENFTVTLACGGVGYEVSVPETILVQLPPIGEPCELRIRQIFREDGTTLYGFHTATQRRVFDLLLTVTGCGPKVALALLGQVGEESIIHAVLAQDPKTLTRATGVGTKLGERIILELREKMHKESLALKIDRTKSASDDLVDALLALGYRRQEAETAAETARAAGGNIEAQIRAALQNLRR